MAMRYGIARGLFSNKAGLGSAPMVHSAAETDHPVRQGMYGIFEVFVDTILVCTTTGLVILVAGAWNSGLTGAALSAKAFEIGLPGTWRHRHGRHPVLLVLNADRLELLRRDRDRVPAGRRSRFLRCSDGVLYLGATGWLHLVWDIADTLNGLMAIPTDIRCSSRSRCC